jgi:hypothetical protein
MMVMVLKDQGQGFPVAGLDQGIDQFGGGEEAHGVAALAGGRSQGAMARGVLPAPGLPRRINASHRRSLAARTQAGPA